MTDQSSNACAAAMQDMSDCGVDTSVFSDTII